MMATEFTEFAFTVSDSLEVVLWCSTGRHSTLVETLAEAVNWAETHSEDDPS
jgi:hypothetical protein